MCENSSSRACSKGVGVDSLRGSERFLVMRGVLLSSWWTGNAGTRATARGARCRRRSRGRRGRRTVAEGSRRMKGFYLLLAAVAVIGGGALWYQSQRNAAPPAPSAPLPVAAADAFHGFTLGSDSAPVEVTEYSDFECPFCASFAT